MAGLMNSSNVLQQRHHLFETQGEARSHHAQQYLQQMLHPGLPARKREDWRCTPLEGLTDSQLVSHVAEITSAQCAALLPAIDVVRLVFVDEQFFPTLSDNISSSSFDVAIDDARQALPAAIQPEVFLHLTESLSRNVIHIQMKHDQRPTKPLLLLHVAQGLAGGEVNTAHYHHHLELAEGTEATAIGHYASLSERRRFTGAHLVMNVAADAHLRHIKLAFENLFSHHFAHDDIQLGANATAVGHGFLLGNAVLRHNTSTQLNGENATLRLNNLAMLVKNEVCDTRTWLEHDKRYCSSRQLHKTIVSDKGQAVFDGLINAAQHAIKTDGRMTDNNLLPGKLAEVGTKPQLEICADDAKCGHGATMGRIDDEQMFYLHPRRIGQQDAQHMILYVFTAELTEALGDETPKQQVLARIAQHLPGGTA